MTILKFGDYRGDLMMKKLFFFVIAIFVLWGIGIYWAINWIDQKEFSDLPEKKEMAVARALWRSFPINNVKDVDRALKFSWLRASTEINRKTKRKKEISEIVSIIDEEAKFIFNYLKSNKKYVSSGKRVISIIQLLTYLNRINLFQNYFESDLDLMLSKVDADINLVEPGDREDWYREMMIRGRLKGNEDVYNKNRALLLETLNKHGGNLPQSFIDGAIDFYDGTLLCITDKAADASSYLKSAATKFAAYPKYTTAFFYADLNVLLIGKGMGMSQACNNALVEVLSAGVQSGNHKSHQD
jgi:hypothetical protein